MAGAGELNDSDYSCGPRPRHVRPILLKSASRYTSRPGHNVFSILNELRRRTRIFLGCTRRKTFDRQLHTYVVRGQVSPRFILCGTFSAWRRDMDSSSLQKPVLFLVAFLLLRRTRFCDASVAASDTKFLPFSSRTIQVLDCVSGSRFIRFFFLMFYVATLRG